MLFLAQHGYRVTACDRGHGRSNQPSSGNDMNTYADDLAAVIDHLDLKNAVLVGHSTGGDELTRYGGRYGTKRVEKVVLIAAVPPILLMTEANPEGLPIEVFDGLRARLVKDPSQFYKDFALMFYDANPAGAKVSQGTLNQFWLWSMQASLKSIYECVKAFSETDFTENFKKFDVSTLLLHGEDDQIVPVMDSSKKSAKLIRGAQVIYYPSGTAVFFFERLVDDGWPEDAGWWPIGGCLSPPVRCSHQRVQGIRRLSPSRFIKSLLRNCNVAVVAWRSRRDQTHSPVVGELIFVGTRRPWSCASYIGRQTRAKGQTN